MKTKLLSLLLTTVLFTGSINAQTKTWDLGNDTTHWPLTAGIGSSEMVVDNLGLFPTTSNTNFGAVNASPYTFTALDGFSAANRWQLNGGGSAAAGTFLPTQRYLYFTATGACTVKVWFRTGGSGARNMLITDGTSLIATAGSSTSGDAFILTGNVTAAQAAAGKIYIYGDTANNLYKITVTGATVNTTLATQSFNQSKLNVVAANKQVNISNVTSNTEVNVYNMTGALVKTLKIDADTTFDLPNSGLYVVNVKSAEGEKSVKVAIK